MVFDVAYAGNQCLYGAAERTRIKRAREVLKMPFFQYVLLQQGVVLFSACL